ncbi:hypothetical protein DL98DRAFT_74137 [Cadophora sp. DSE1049]|nr:hypothetical protein DL98DRAFT_74137 [Cadophora sp. DSE1049]
MVIKEEGCSCLLKQSPSVGELGLLVLVHFLLSYLSPLPSPREGDHPAIRHVELETLVGPPPKPAMKVKCPRRARLSFGKSPLATHRCRDTFQLDHFRGFEEQIEGFTSAGKGYCFLLVLCPILGMHLGVAMNFQRSYLLFLLGRTKSRIQKARWISMSPDETSCLRVRSCRVHQELSRVDRPLSSSFAYLLGRSPNYHNPMEWADPATNGTYRS